MKRPVECGLNEGPHSLPLKRLWLLFLGKGAASSLLSGWGQGPLLEDILTYSQ